MRISDWSSDVCSSDLTAGVKPPQRRTGGDEIRGGVEVGGEGAADTVAEAGEALGVDQQRFPALHAVAGVHDGHGAGPGELRALRSEEHTSELQSLMRISYAVFCLKKKKTQQ